MGRIGSKSTVQCKYIYVHIRNKLLFDVFQNLHEEFYNYVITIMIFIITYLHILELKLEEGN